MALPKPITLIVLDGWGYREETSANAIAAAKTPFWHQLWNTCPHTLLSASGIDVGLPPGQMGNSEVGHLHMGAGRLVPQDLRRIDIAIETKEFFQNPTLTAAIKKAAQTQHAVHILGLLSPGGVHSHENHIFALAELATTLGAPFYLHPILDGRDTPPKSALASIEKLENKLHALQHGKIASLIGRYYAMDRDKRWERTQKAYDMLTLGKAEFHADSATTALAMAYARNETDEFVHATIIQTAQQKPITIQDDDVIIFMNFRADRARQLTRAFTEDNFNGFTREARPRLGAFVTLTEYAADINAQVVYPPIVLKNGVGELLASQYLHQLRIAETEKYAHVTYFFNGGREQPFPNEDRILIPSPKVATYDLQPTMSANEVTDRLVEAICKGNYDVIICNYANPDMLGHTGDMHATVTAIETINDCLQRVVTALKDVGGEAIITADHGNAEMMFDPKTGQPHTAHTTLPVPFIYVGRPAEITTQKGVLYDIGPTLLTLLGIPIPKEMTGKSLVRFL
jgi:2,3-bisphosphoglycerate-independent phosphoglycerate mutase